jgi:TetR/AcrR family transcriptional repressor of nem operon
MRYSDEHKQTVRAKIVDAASRALRRDGLDGVSIPALMKRAGLTHGGFYSHFDDRDELVAEAVRHAAHETADGVFAAAPSLDAALAAYLSAHHVDHAERGCVVAALGADAPRQRAPVREVFAWAARGLLQLVQDKLSTQRKGLSDEALEITSRMVGAVVLARLLDDPTLRSRLLSVARRR